MSNKKYYEKFEEIRAYSLKDEKLFDTAHDIRKFEIDMYWRRSGYFWAITALAFTGYFAVSTAYTPHTAYISSHDGLQTFELQWYFSLIIALIGFVLTFAWFLANRGSKYWQENWENHLNLLEDKVIGPLYKTTLKRPKHANIAEQLFFGPNNASVSKINSLVSLFILFVWFFLAAISFYYSFYNSLEGIPHNYEHYFLFQVIFISILSFFISYFLSSVMKIKQENSKDNKIATRLLITCILVLVILYIASFFSCMTCNFFLKFDFSYRYKSILFLHTTPISFCILFCVFLFTLGRTHGGDHGPVMETRSVTVVENPSE